MDYSKNVYKLYLIIFFHSLIPAYVIERLFWEQRGMTVLGVVLCEVVYAATIVLLEIPTGVLADKLSRKVMLMVASFLSMLEFVLLIFADSFYDFAFVVFLAGISGACTSGAFNALLYDSLLWVNKQTVFERILGRLNSLDIVAALLAALSGGVLARYYDLEVNYIVSIVSTFIALIAVISLREPPRSGVEEAEQNDAAGFRTYIQKALGFYRENPSVGFMAINAAAIGATVNYVDEFWQLYLRDAGVAVLYFGIFSALILLIRIPGNLLSANLAKYFKGEHILAFVLFTSALGFFVAGIFPGIIGIAALVVIFLVSGLVEPLVAGYVHHKVDSSIRATVDSVQSLAKRAIMIVAGLGFGYISSNASLKIGFVFLGAVITLFLVLYVKRIKRL